MITDKNNPNDILNVALVTCLILSIIIDENNVIKNNSNGLTSSFKI